MNEVCYSRSWRSPVGELRISVSPEGLKSLDWVQEAVPVKKSGRWDDRCKEVFARTRDQLAEYFEGRRKVFDLPLALEGSPFQKKVWRELLNIPFGQTVSYGTIARRIGQPGASRAVGSANGKNPVCVIVPCHRVIAGDGSLGGYSAGIQYKKKLLGLEERYRG